MGLRDKFVGDLTRLKRDLVGPKETKWLDAYGNPKMVAWANEGLSIPGINNYKRNNQRLKEYWNFYAGEGTVFAAIETIVWNTVMTGFQVNSEDDVSRQLIRDFVQKVDLTQVLLDNVRYALIFGDAFIELRKDKSGDIGELRTIDPKTVVIDTDKFGKVRSYKQKVGGKVDEKNTLKPDEMMHLQFFPNPTGPYGLSIIEPSIVTIDRKIKVDYALFNAIIRHGTPKYKIKVGTPEEVPPKVLFDKIKSDFADVSSKDEYVLPGPIDIQTIDGGGVKGVESYYDTFLTQELIGLLAMPEALGLGTGSTEATAHVREVLHERMIRAFQHKLQSQTRIDLFNPVLESNSKNENTVNIKFKSVTTADEEGMAKWLGNLLRGGVIIFSINEMRAMFGYDPIKDGDDVIGAVEETPQEEEPSSGDEAPPEMTTPPEASSD